MEVNGNPRFRRAPLFWRVFIVNAAILAVASSILAFSPATISQPVALAEAVVLSLGLALMLVVNLLMLRRVFGPLARLARVMRSIDPLRPGHRIPVYGPDAEVVALTESFNDMLDRLETERRESARRALAAQEGERRRIARELHDEIGQQLTAVVLQLERSAREVPDEPAREMVVEAKEAVRDSLANVRRIARELRPEALDDLGLAAALAALTSSLAERTGLRIDRRIDRTLPPLRPEVDVVVYRVAQESLTNVARHAEATRVVLTLEGCKDEEEVVLTVRDDGKGMDPAAPGPVTGIRGMRERAVLVGGRLHIESAPGRGTEVRLVIPADEAIP